MTKNELRELMKAQRRALSADDIKTFSSAITKNVCSLPCFICADTVMIYISSFKEPDTHMLLDYIFAHGKKCVVPVSDTDTFNITPSYIKSADDLKQGAYGIPEPRIINPAAISDIDIALIPGIAFDIHGNRTGFGKGYYDRFLSEFKGVKIGVCYDFQIQTDIPADTHDIKMDFIITEKRIYNDF